MPGQRSNCSISWLSSNPLPVVAGRITPFGDFMGSAASSTDPEIGHVQQTSGRMTSSGYAGHDNATRDHL